MCWFWTRTHRKGIQFDLFAMWWWAEKCLSLYAKANDWVSSKTESLRSIWLSSRCLTRWSIDGNSPDRIIFIYGFWINVFQAFCNSNLTLSLLPEKKFQSDFIWNYWKDKSNAKKESSKCHTKYSEDIAIVIFNQAIANASNLFINSILYAFYFSSNFQVK